MSDRKAFFRAIAENPDDDTPRLAFADWLAEHGEWDRAEIIWEGIRDPKTMVICPWGFKKGESLKDSITDRVMLSYHRGMACEAQTTAKRWLDDGPEIIAENPLIKRVELRDKKPWAIGSEIFIFFDENHIQDSFVVPNQIFRHLPLASINDVVLYETEKSAVSDLSAACIKYAKSRIPVKA